MSKDILTLSGSASVSAPPDVVFQMLIDPAEQVKWNSLYEEAHVEPAGEVRTGSVMKGTFKGSGKSTVYFEDVIAGRQFVHYSPLKMFNLINLGEFRHKYEVADAGGQTRVTQTVYFEPKGVGKLLAGTVMGSFKKRLPESFQEFERYLARAR
jgi:carbon monoxide dehydrogenase subunit G